MNQRSTTTESTAHKVTIEDIFGQATRKVKSLLAQIEQATGSNGDNGDGIAELKQLLEALPFSTAEFGLATNRLRNANRYLQSQERGAARYELKMLALSLGRNRHQGRRPSPEVGLEQLPQAD